MPNMVSFRTGDYSLYDNENFIPGCLYYLTETDENDEVINSYIFLNGVRYGADATVQTMARFGSYTYNSVANIGLITPDAGKLRISNLQTTTTPSDSRDVVNKKYVDEHTGTAYIVDLTNTASIKSTIEAYLNNPQKQYSIVLLAPNGISRDVNADATLIPISRISKETSGAINYSWYFNNVDSFDLTKYYRIGCDATYDIEYNSWTVTVIARGYSNYSLPTVQWTEL